MKTAIVLVFVLAGGVGMQGNAQLQPFTHVIIAVQENQSPDSLFSACPIPNADLVQIGTGVRLAAMQELPHTHAAWLKNYRSGIWPAASKHYVVEKDVDAYCQIAAQFGFANAMFQTNQGPSFPAHQFLFSATSAPYAGSDLMAAENVSGAPCAVGSVDQFIDPQGLMHSFSSCMDHGTISDEAEAAGLTWRYYAEPSGLGVNLWNPAEAIRHICIASGQMTGGGDDATAVRGIDGQLAGSEDDAGYRIYTSGLYYNDRSPQVGRSTICTGADYTANVVLNPTKALADIAAGDLANITFVTPGDLYSDHPGTHGNGGPAWIASIVNAVESNPALWPNTAIVVVWDDWGGRWDHVQPLVNNTASCASYCYGGRVPLLVVSPYTPAMVSDQPCDFSCILAFIEHNFNLGLIGDGSGMDAYAAGDLSEYFTQERKPVQIQTRELTKEELETTGQPDDD